MPFQAKMVLDSVSPFDVRLTTMELCYPLIVHNELLTHRTIGRSDDHEFEEWIEYSRNSSSNRAISSEKIIAQVRDDPYFPANPRYSSKGMIPGEYMQGEDKQRAIDTWLDARYAAIDSVKELQNEIRLAKQWRNRIIGPWQFITVVATANESHWLHFFNLRNHHAAQDEIKQIAEMAQAVFTGSTPQLLEVGDWHTPYVTDRDIALRGTNTYKSEEQFIETKKRVSVAKCARTSFLRQDEEVHFGEDLTLYNRLRDASPPHGSPFEHVAQAAQKDTRSGNFYGFKQFRKELGI